MGIQNTKDLHNYIVKKDVSDESAESIEQIIKAFSEFIVAVNPDYIYNKTYMGAFVEDFILCQKSLKQKYQILIRKILPQFLAEGIEKECEITIDGAWKFEKGAIKLNNSLNQYYVKRNKMQIEIELIHDKGFVVAEEINIDRECDKAIDDCILTFLNRRKEL